jgi:hypothetical protein
MSAEQEREEALEAFAAWRGHPVTLQVMRALEAKEVEAKDMWLRLSWDAGKCDERLRADLKATAGTYRYVIEIDAEEVEAVLAQSERD